MRRYRSRQTRLPRKPVNDERNSSAGIVDEAVGAAEALAEEILGEAVATTEALVAEGGRARRLASAIEGTVGGEEGLAAADSETLGFPVVEARLAAVAVLPAVVAVRRAVVVVVVVDIAMPEMPDVAGPGPEPVLGLCRCAQPRRGRPRAPPVLMAAGGPCLDRPAHRLAGAAHDPGLAPPCPVETHSSGGGHHVAAPAPCRRIVDRPHRNVVVTRPLGAAAVGEA